MENINQLKIIQSDQNLLVLASAGCGKSYTISKKISRLLLTLDPSEILVLSFTNETVNDLLKKLPPGICVTTFHKLSMSILNDKTDISLCDDSFLDTIIDEFFLNKVNSKDIILLKKFFFIKKYDDILTSYSFFELKKVIKNFIKLMHCNNKNISFLKKIFMNSKDKFLITFIMKIFYFYELSKKENNFFDFDDLIIYAGDEAKNKKFSYKYIFVDEAQDMSQIRFDLVHNIFLNSNSVINFFGDDFQSIYAFSGCDLSIMMNLKNFINDIEIMHLDTNFRSSNKLIKCANNFVMKNPYQFKKNVTGLFDVDKPINFVKFKNIENEIKKIILSINEENPDILFLGRYKKDLEVVPKNFKKMTIHESKGLEADYVILLNLLDGKYGLPSKITNNKILNCFENSEKFLFAEERRIFYVALTRAKKKIFLMIPSKDISSFVPELKKICKNFKI